MSKPVDNGDPGVHLWWLFSKRRHVDLLAGAVGGTLDENLYKSSTLRRSTVDDLTKDGSLVQSLDKESQNGPH